MFDLPCLCLTFCYEPGGRRHQMCRPADGHPSNQPKWHVACQCHVSCGPWTVLHVTYLTNPILLYLSHLCLQHFTTNSLLSPCLGHWPPWSIARRTLAHRVAQLSVCFSCALDILDPRHLSTKLHQFASQQNHTGPYRRCSSPVFMDLHGQCVFAQLNDDSKAQRDCK